MQGFGAWTELVHNQSQCQSIKKPLLDISNFDYAHAPFFKRIKTTLLKKKEEEARMHGNITYKVSVSYAQGIQLKLTSTCKFIKWFQLNRNNRKHSLIAKAQNTSWRRVLNPNRAQKENNHLQNIQ